MSSGGYRIEWLGDLLVQELCDIQSKLQTKSDVRGLCCFYGSWNKKELPAVESMLRHWNPTIRENRRYVIGMVQADASEETLSMCLGDDDCQQCMPCPPGSLPALAVIFQDASMDRAIIQFVEGVHPQDLSRAASGVWNSVQSTFNALILQKSFPVGDDDNGRTIRKNGRKRKPVPNDAIRIFVAGDRSSVGKSSVCLGILGNLLVQGYKPSSLAYIKPATQCEATQLIQKFCESRGIACVPVGPVVYYKGFTRAFLAGETENTAALLEQARGAVDNLANDKEVVLIDGVGFPAVGSICGTDNASVAGVCGYENQPPGVLVVGPSGVGNAVDSFNLNATYFSSRDIPVIGAVFNKLADDGYYSLENCRSQVTSYFSQFQPTRQVFGFIPLFSKLAEESAMDHVDEFVSIFGEHVDVLAIVQAADRIRLSSSPMPTTQSTFKRLKHPYAPGLTSMTSVTNGGLSRAEIEQRAMSAGAAPSA